MIKKEVVYYDMIRAFNEKDTRDESIVQVSRKHPKVSKERLTDMWESLYACLEFMDGKV